VNNFSALLIFSLWSVIPQKVPYYVVTFNPLKTGESESTFQASASQFSKESCFLKVPRFHPLVHLLIATCQWRWVWSIGGMKLTGENWSTQTKTCLIATLSTSDFMEWPGIQCRCPLWEASNYISWPWHTWFESSLHIKIHLIPHRECSVLPLERQVSECYKGKYCLFIVKSYEAHKCTVWAKDKLSSVKPSGTYSDH